MADKVEPLIGEAVLATEAKYDAVRANGENKVGAAVLTTLSTVGEPIISAGEAVAKQTQTNYSNLRGVGETRLGAVILTPLGTIGEPLVSGGEQVGKVYDAQRAVDENRVGSGVIAVLYFVARQTGVADLNEAYVGTSSDTAEKLTDREQGLRFVNGGFKAALTITAGITAKGAWSNRGSKAVDAPEPPWKDFLPEAEARLAAAKAKYGDGAVAMAISRKQALIRIDGLTNGGRPGESIADHIGKLSRPGSGPHIRTELKARLDEIERLATHTGKKTEQEIMLQVQYWRELISEIPDVPH